jgi:hypothetical protein
MIISDAPNCGVTCVDSRGIIYNGNKLIIKATGAYPKGEHLKLGQDISLLTNIFFKLVRAGEQTWDLLVNFNLFSLTLPLSYSPPPLY